VTEAEWLCCTDPTPMLAFLRGKASERKLRLFAVACCRRIWGLLTDERSRQAVEVAERYADGLVSSRELRFALEDAKAAYCDGGDAFYGLRTDIPPPHSTAPHATAMHTAVSGGWSPSEAANSAAYAVFSNPRRPYSQEEVNAAVAPECAAQAVLLRDIFGNPFRPVVPDPAWQTLSAVTLARTIYDERSWELLPLLADLLEEAGCPAEVSDHCRGPGPHVRGCWVVDFLLGKE
jgi:hypothetical protein